MPTEYHLLIKDAMREYSENTKITYDYAIAKRYAEYMIEQIKQAK